MPDTLPCKICSAAAVFVGERRGKFKQDLFRLFRCSNCGFAFLGNPWLDFASVYDAAYYDGRGSDPLIDYVFELDHPAETIRQYEWEGILQVVSNYVVLHPETHWLDFGCGNGGLVRYVREHLGCAISGYDEGWIRQKALAQGIPILSRDEVDAMTGQFDIVTAIEVLEHVLDPIAELRRIRSLLKSGGLLFFTTGNAAPHRNKLLDWTYFVPEMHIGYFEPGTMALALQKCGFRPEFRGFVPGYEKIIRFKVLKELKVRRTAAWEKILPWKLLSRIVDSRLHVTAHPVGWAIPFPG